MEMNEEIRIQAPREAVYAALNDPDILQQAIPGCETLEKTSDSEFTATIVIKVGPVKAKFNGAVALSDLNPPESYTISGEGKAGPAGHAKGGANIQLVEDGDGTILKYQVEAKIGGKLAQMGSRLIDSTAKKLAGTFFKTFEGLVAQPAASDDTSRPSAASPAAPAETGKPSNPTVWLIGAIIILGGLIYFATAN